MDRPAASPVTAEEFSVALARIGPWEAGPAVAVAVSGGPDSLALCLLADRWARNRGGCVLALTVDHGLRPEAADEAAAVGRWLAARSIDQQVLRWRPAAATGSVQAAARDARYRLLEGACSARGILHLMLAHTLDDQAETVLLRLAKGSGVDGLAAMAPVREAAEVRLLRPLLDITKARLRDTCRSFGQSWLDDPSNRSHRFARGRLRGVSAALAAEGLTPDRLAATARRAARARAALETAAAELLARCATLYPEGYAVLDLPALRAASPELSLRALARCVTAVGGGAHPPRLERLERVYGALRDDGAARGRTLAGCCLRPLDGGPWLIHREPAAATDRQPVSPDAADSARTVRWDNRFRVTLPHLPRPRGRLELRRLGQSGRSTLATCRAPAPGRPAAVMLSLPGLWDGDLLLGLPRFAGGEDGAESAGLLPFTVAFAPSWQVAGSAFAVV
ncbi:MAG: tRNA lysidine(34) synthetase TilS [Alphaproteobacteria bacterium]